MFLSEKMNQALAKTDLDLAAAQKTADEKTALADQKLAQSTNWRKRIPS